MDHSYKREFDDIIIVPFDKETSEKYRLLRNRPDISVYFPSVGIISKEQQDKWFESYLESDDDIMFAVFDTNNTFLGGNSIYHISSDSAEYGRIIIDNNFAGHSYGYKATMAAALIAKHNLNLKQLELCVYEDNISAIKTYKKAGYIENGTTVDKDGKKMISMILDLNQI